MEFQTRRNSGEIRLFSTFAEALKDAQDKEVWKLSFGLPTGERVRLVVTHHKNGAALELRQMPDFEALLNRPK